MITIYSSNGFFHINRQGEIIYSEWSDGNHEIAKFDMDDYFQAYPEEESEPDSAIDILDIGFWTSTGEYEPAEPSYRGGYCRNEMNLLR